ncbi:unnamed protein product [Somion occarium]|uniref:Uncharacterized protein n=1 Tax=Somion occarium TaxID=3059160 RepID=A0ABP1CYI7_9APHY
MAFDWYRERLAAYANNIPRHSDSSDTVWKHLSYGGLSRAIRDSSSLINPREVKTLTLAVRSDIDNPELRPPLILSFPRNFAEVNSVERIILGHVDLCWHPFPNRTQATLRVLCIQNLVESSSGFSSAIQILDVLGLCPYLEEVILANIGQVPEVQLPVKLNHLQNLRVLSSVSSIRNLLANLEVPRSASVYLKTFLDMDENWVKCLSLPPSHRFLPLLAVTSVVITSGGERGGFIVEGFKSFAPCRINELRAPGTHITIEVGYKDTKDIWLGSLTPTVRVGTNSLTQEAILQFATPRRSEIAAKAIAQVPAVFERSQLHLIEIRCETSNPRITEADWKHLYTSFSSVQQFKISNIADTINDSRTMHWHLWLSVLVPQVMSGELVYPTLRELYLYGIHWDEGPINALYHALKTRAGMHSKVHTLRIDFRNEKGAVPLDYCQKLKWANVVDVFYFHKMQDAYGTELGPGFKDF